MTSNGFQTSAEISQAVLDGGGVSRPAAPLSGPLHARSRPEVRADGSEDLHGRGALWSEKERVVSARPLPDETRRTLESGDRIQKRPRSSEQGIAPARLVRWPYAPNTVQEGEPVCELSPDWHGENGFRRIPAPEDCKRPRGFRQRGGLGPRPPAHLGKGSRADPQRASSLVEGWQPRKLRVGESRVAHRPGTYGAHHHPQPAAGIEAGNSTYRCVETEDREAGTTWRKTKSRTCGTICSKRSNS